MCESVRERERESLLNWKKQCLIPYFQEAVPGAGGHRHAVLCHAQAAHTIVVARQNSFENQQVIRGWGYVKHML